MVSDSSRRQQNLITLCLRAAHALTDELVARLADAGYQLRPAHGRVFENLDPHGTRLSDLAEQRQPVRASPRVAAIAREIETRRSGVRVLHADRHGEK